MKRFLTIVPVIAALLVSSCSKPTASTDNQSTDPTPPPAPSTGERPSAPPPKAGTATTSSTGEPATGTSTAQPTPPPKVLAPEGTLFAVQRISVTNDDGVFSVPGGARLRIVKKLDSGYMVTDGKHEFPVEAQQVTNEVGTATAAAQTHVAERSADTAATQAQTAAQAEMARAQREQQNAAAGAAMKDVRVRTLQGKSLALAGEIAELSAKIQNARNEAQRSYEATHIYGKVSTRSIDPALMTGWQRRMAVAQQEKQTVDAEVLRVQMTP